MLVLLAYYILYMWFMHMLVCDASGFLGCCLVNIYIPAFVRCFYPKQLTMHSKYTPDQFMHPPGIKPVTLVLQAP